MSVITYATWVITPLLRTSRLPTLAVDRSNDRVNVTVWAGTTHDFSRPPWEDDQTSLPDLFPAHLADREPKAMDYATPLAGYLLLTLVIMFGGRKRRTFTHASHTAAATLIGTLCLASLLWFFSNAIYHLTLR
jgi:hypothetical protein